MNQKGQVTPLFITCTLASRFLFKARHSPTEWSAQRHLPSWTPSSRCATPAANCTLAANGTCWSPQRTAKDSKQRAWFKWAKAWRRERTLRVSLRGLYTNNYLNTKRLKFLNFRKMQSSENDFHFKHLHTIQQPLYVTSFCTVALLLFSKLHVAACAAFKIHILPRTRCVWLTYLFSPCFQLLYSISSTDGSSLIFKRKRRVTFLLSWHLWGHPRLSQFHWESPLVALILLE